MVLYKMLHVCSFFFFHFIFFHLFLLAGGYLLYSIVVGFVIHPTFWEMNPWITYIEHVEE